MNRREFLSIFLLGSVSTAGCVQMDTQPEEVPIWVKNQTGHIQHIFLECIEQGSGDPLLSTEVELGSGEEKSVYAEPMTAEGEYKVSIEVEHTVEEESISGGGLRDISVEIHAVDEITISTVST